MINSSISCLDNNTMPITSAGLIYLGSGYNPIVLKTAYAAGVKASKG